VNFIAAFDPGIVGVVVIVGLLTKYWGAYIGGRLAQFTSQKSDGYWLWTEYAWEYGYYPWADRIGKWIDYRGPLYWAGDSCIDFQCEQWSVNGLG